MDGRKKKSDKRNRNQDRPVFLVAVDFSHCSKLALRKAKDLMEQWGGRIVVFHVIDHDFVAQCIHGQLGEKGQIKKKLFIGAKARLQEFVRKEGLEGDRIEKIVCEGAPCIEINKKAAEVDAEMIIIGSQGKSEDMKSIFFGSTAERVLRFITRPVLCVPPDIDPEKGNLSSAKV
jgi:nucleotide-binding universal stress UspA family protein